MTTPFWCLLVAVLIPYVLAFTAAYFKGKQFGTVDNNQPRVQGAALTGTGARVWAAQQNAWEALAVFTAAVLVARFAGADPGRSAMAALLFIAARIVHAICYATDLATFRSLSFMVGFASCLWLFWLAASVG
jgi:uncharacterized MAPEG superfamily protein